MTDLIGGALDLLDPPAHPHAGDPSGWIRRRLRETIWSAQDGICQTVAAHPKTAVQSCHGAGKSHLVSRLIGWWIDIHPPGEAFVVSTAPTFPQVRGILWRYVGQMFAQAQTVGAPLPGRVLQTCEWKIGSELVGWGRKPADTDEHGFQGIHARHVLVIVDEACGIPASLWTGVEAITTTAGSRIVAIGNPDDPTSEFAKKCRPGSGWQTIRIDGLNTPNMSLETLERAAEACEPPLTDDQRAALLDEAAEAGVPETDGDREPVSAQLRDELLQPYWVADKVRAWGIGSPMWQAKVRGAFPDTAEDALIPLSWITNAQNRETDTDGPWNVTVDVARFGSDETVLGLRQAGRFRILTTRRRGRTTATSGLAATTAREQGVSEIRVDADGVGGGVADELVAEGWRVIEMHAGQSPNDRDRFLNARAEWYWGLRQRFEDGDVDLDPADEELAGQLAALRYEFTARGQVKIESKDDMRSRGMPSPDRADTAMLAFAHVPDTAGVETYEDRVTISPY